MEIRKLFILFCCLFLISACTPQQENGTETNFKQGYGEVNLIFEENKFPTRVYQNTPISLSLIVQNDAAYDTKNLRVSIAGFDPTYVDVPIPEQTVDSLEGKNVFNPAGGREFLTFEGAVKGLLNNAEYQLQNYWIYLKYSSSIEFSPTVCINPNFQQVYDSGCTLPSGPVSFQGQGGSVAVETMDEVIRPGTNPEVEFRLTVMNHGRGKIEKISLGETRLGNTQIPCMFREADVINPRELTITPSISRIELVCTARLESQNSYPTTLFLGLLYDYEVAVPKSLRIEK